MKVVRIVISILLAVLLSAGAALAILAATPEVTGLELGLIAGAVLSLLFEYAPGFEDWYNLLTDKEQQLSMLGLLFLSGATIYGMACGGILALVLPDVTVECTFSGAVTLFVLFLSEIVANQSVHRVLPSKGGSA